MGVQEVNTEWIIELAKDRARAEQDSEWEQKMKGMLQVIKDQVTNRKPIARLKEPHQSVQNIQMLVKQLFLPKGTKQNI